MNEWVFPVVGAASVFLIAVPLLTLFARGLLEVLPTRSDEVAAHASGLRYLLIVGPTFAPVVWLVSASIHQSEAGAPLVACIIDHLGGELCLDVVLFAIALTGIVGLSAAHRGWRERGAPRGHSAVKTDSLVHRVRRICAANERLASLSSRVVVVDGGVAPACTLGLFKPRVALATSLTARLTDEGLEAVLLHEAEHALNHDPARFFLAHVALSLNPLGRMLTRELSRHHFAREALCDRQAVEAGADPLTLADCIVSVAAPIASAAPVAALGGHGIEGVRLRVQLLLGYANERPAVKRSHPRLGLASALLLALALGPHVFGTGPLDTLHHGIERAALVVGLE